MYSLSKLRINMGLRNVPFRQRIAQAASNELLERKPVAFRHTKSANSYSAVFVNEAVVHEDLQRPIVGVILRMKVLHEVCKVSNRSSVVQGKVYVFDVEPERSWYVIVIQFAFAHTVLLLYER